METFIGDHPPDSMYRNGVEIDCQCARCGSSCDYVDCGHCDEGSLGSDCIDDLCHGGECIHGDSGFIPCDICGGAGGWHECLSSPEFCNGNPLPGRENVERGKIEWFTIESAEDFGKGILE